MKKNNGDYERLAGLFGALANPIRLRILDALSSNCTCSGNGGSCVYEINEIVGLPQPYISKHLGILKKCGILDYRREANRIVYSFKDRRIIRELLDRLEKYSRCC
ncbi:MAG: metalloregulator ArsR/SmtB family transcription factor [Spirochaetes bacterium]|jgi:ArsR family transcriptional regulator|nr:metalloregulator ArsR/SmtB family transcription factor [Spirochaetota bacterium]